jgi:hypothetical protein
MRYRGRRMVCTEGVGKTRDGFVSAQMGTPVTLARIDTRVRDHITSRYTRI